MTTQDLKYFAKVQELYQQSQPFASVTLVAGKGHIPQNIGAKMLVGEHGLLFGTVGGGEVEAQVIEFAQSMLRSREAKQILKDWNLQTDSQMTCGGEVSLFFEVYRPNDWHVAVFGAGHVAQALVPVLLTLDCQVTCIDSRAEWLERLPPSPKLTRVLSEDLSSEVEKLPGHAFMMVMTQGHVTDMPILKKIYDTRKAPYVGVIGSKVKAQAAKSELKEAGIAEEKFADLKCPMGLKLGSNAPAEIAIGMAAEILQVRQAYSRAETQL